MDVYFLTCHPSQSCIFSQMILNVKLVVFVDKTLAVVKQKSHTVHSDQGVLNRLCLLSVQAADYR